MNTRFSTRLISLVMAAILISIPFTAVQAAPVSARGRIGLNQTEADGLAYMREEEKLAHDIYVLMYAKWGLAVFSNISSAESNHMAALKTLLDRYGLLDPVQGNGTGVFVNQDLQTLYNTLVARGNISLAEALKVGGLIEEVDIIDLENRLALTKRSDMINVYNNLIDGSCNHLRAFSTNVQRRTGETYQPQLLSLADYQAIINGTH